MNKIKAILTFVLTVIKVNPIKSNSNNGFNIFKPISQAHLHKLKGLCEQANWTCTHFPAIVNQKTGESISDELTWFGLQSAKKDLSMDELMTQASEIQPKSE